MLNIPQENRKLLAIERLLALNNYVDCDVIQDSVDRIKKAENTVNLISAFGYAISAIEYREKKVTATKLKELSEEIASYGSLYQAIENKDQQAIGWWESQANSGVIVRIM